MKDENDIKKIREILESLLKQKISEGIKKLNEKERKVYELTGSMKRNDIMKSLKMSPNKLAEIWGRLAEQGVLVKEGKGYKKVI